MSEVQPSNFQSRLAKAIKEGGTHVIDVSPDAGTTPTLAQMVASIVKDGRPVLFITDSQDCRKKVFEAIRDAGADQELLQFLSSHQSVAGIRFKVDGLEKRPDVVIWESEMPLSYELTNRFGHIAAKVGSISTGISLAILTARITPEVPSLEGTENPTVESTVENQVAAPDTQEEQQPE